MNASPSRLYTIDALRGLAALSVCWFHFTYDSGKFLPDGFLKSSGEFGQLGVEIFFVISGFVIPYALHRGGYQILDYNRFVLKRVIRLSDYGTFILKRIVRLEPPYLCAILFAIGIQYAIPGYGVAPFHFLIVQVFLHLGYVNEFFGYPWLIGVFWTLGIEMQYYLLVGLLFPVIAHKSLIVRICCFGCLASLAFIDEIGLIFDWLFLFMLGMAAFQFRVGICQRREYFAWMVVIGLGAWYVNGSTVAITAIATALLLGLVETGAKNPLLFFGRISYSLYLLHSPIGALVMGLSIPFVHTMSGKCAVLAATLAASIISAWLLYRFVERPAQEWSSRIRYRKKQGILWKTAAGIIGCCVTGYLIFALAIAVAEAHSR
jgi:peptidoglycan/LPS O-acetylase OafA/YrhL